MAFGGEKESMNEIITSRNTVRIEINAVDFVAAWLQGARLFFRSKPRHLVTALPIRATRTNTF